MSRPILITGSHRSGSTWVGRILGTAPGLGYIQEPFKPTTYPGVVPQPFPDWYHYLCAENQADATEIFSRVLQFDFHARAAWSTVRSPRSFVRFCRRWARQSRLRRRRCRPLLKDPFALFSTEWLIRNFDTQVVMLIRHPAAFVSSLKLKGWNFDFNDFLRQPLLIRDLLAPFENDIARFAREKQGIVEQSALLWNCVHHVVHTFRTRHPDWIFIRHEDLSRDPQTGFQELFQKLDVPFDHHTRAKIQELSGEHNPAERSDRGGSRRNSRENIQNWKHRLTPAEIQTVRRLTHPVSPLFYSESDW
jgi:hypothetical protein